jgi:hypothetical protein
MKSNLLNRAHFKVTHIGDAVVGLVVDRETALGCGIFLP